VKDWESARKSDTARFSRYFRRMLDEGVYLAPSQFEAGFVSTAHGPAEVEATLKAAEIAFAGLS
jgi:glutamate-1-semialdehyde 2,1-aminomutase